MNITISSNEFQSPVLLRFLPHRLIFCSKRHTVIVAEDGRHEYGVFEANALE